MILYTSPVCPSVSILVSPVIVRVSGPNVVDVVVLVVEVLVVDVVVVPAVVDVVVVEVEVVPAVVDVEVVDVVVVIPSCKHS